MSFGKKKFEAQPDESRSFLRCSAMGCKMKGSITGSSGDGAKYTCRFHFNAPFEQWQTINDKLEEWQHIIIGADEVQGISHAKWMAGEWIVMQNYFAHDVELQPSDAEKSHKIWYQTRLLNWVNYLAGNLSKRPEKREQISFTTSKRK